MKMFAGLAGGAAVGCPTVDQWLAGVPFMHTCQHSHTIPSHTPSSYMLRLSPLYLCTIYISSMTHTVSIDTSIYIGIHDGVFASSFIKDDLFKHPMSDFFNTMS
jgi:hypothetical protein